MTLTPYARNGTTVQVRDNTDRAVLAQVQDEYPWSELPKNPRCVIDVGAHAGYFMIEAHKRWPDALIYSAEPDTDNYHTMYANVCDLPNMLPFHAYIGYAEGDYALARHKVHSSGHIVVPTTFKSDAYDVVPLRCPRFTLEQWHNPNYYIDLLKLDCEGAEKDILLNMTGRMMGYIRQCIVGRRHGTLEQFEPIYNRLRRAGFTVKDTMSAHSQARGIFLAKRETFA